MKVTKSHVTFSASPQQTTVMTAEKFGFCDIVISLCWGEIRYQATMTFVLLKHELQVRNVHRIAWL
jgi:hypothetical protein